MSNRSRCGAVRISKLADEPSAEIVCVSNRSRCGAVRISKLADEPSAEIVRVGALSLWFSQKISTKVVREARSRSSGLRIASFK